MDERIRRSKAAQRYLNDRWNLHTEEEHIEFVNLASGEYPIPIITPYQINRLAEAMRSNSKKTLPEFSFGQFSFRLFDYKNLPITTKKKGIRRIEFTSHNITAQHVNKNIQLSPTSSIHYYRWEWDGTPLDEDLVMMKLTVPSRYRSLISSY